MSNPWLAIDVTTDPTERAREVRRAWEAFVSGAGDGAGLRAPITDSWRRCADAGVPSAGPPRPPVLGATELNERWEVHPLRRVLRIVREALVLIADASRHLLVVSDAEGRLLSIEGHPRVRLRAADEMSFIEGALWSEHAAGTNAVGTAIATDHAVQVFATEHFNEVVQGWTCAAAPIHDPATGRLLGVIDLTGRYTTVHPHSLALAATTAAAVESQLRTELRERDVALRERHLERVIHSRGEARALLDGDGRVLLAEPQGLLPTRFAVPGGGGEVALPDGRRAVVEPLGSDGAFLLRAPTERRRHAPTLALVTLGRDRGLVCLAGRELQLSQRHTEILVLLVASRNGMTAEELALALYGEGGRPATVRTEMFRLRRLLGTAIEAEPYRVALPVEADFLAVEASLRAGDRLAAARCYAAPLLPGSEAPGIVAAREELDIWMRSAVMAAGDREVLWAWLQSRSGRDDMPAWRRFLAGIDFDDPRRAQAAGRLAQLREGLVA